MKKLMFALVALATLSFTACKEGASAKVDESKKEIAEERDSKTQAYPVMEFEEQEFDFGTVEEGEVVEHTFVFTNTGDAPLIVSNAVATCGCTVPTWTKKAISPGDKGEMLVKFNTRGKPNQQMKAVRITANTQSGRETLRIKAFVNPQNSNAGSPVK
ncbi:DUF1573 domain-containing protein [Psychroflexus lacisalsi]|jgi:uncharacterized protein (DUF58 family)|uniref:DUF1573 domain-containing protein n=1 Tax=Psychroflexus lacisalsi TaxID=503928 RepID=A0ABP3VLB2_9FLAO|nr:DUF1573 domain-containing protein [Psychroflexus lacisalsi]MBZ9620163.1 DUF1573 domain-containing protein [Psychroflexus lacisalsi]